jgi:hypothetical protein
MHRTQVLPIHMGIDLRGRQVGVAEHLLNGPEVRAALQKVGRKAVTCGVTRLRTPARSAARFTTPQAPTRDRGSPRALRSTRPLLFPRSSSGRMVWRYTETAPITVRPIGTSRSLLPFPNTRTRFSGSSRSVSPRVHSSDTRSPAP